MKNNILFKNITYKWRARYKLNSLYNIVQTLLLETINIKKLNLFLKINNLIVEHYYY